MLRLRPCIRVADVIGRGRIALGIEVGGDVRKGCGVGVKFSGCYGERHEAFLGERGGGRAGQDLGFAFEEGLTLRLR